jgi:hypothetical protein
MKKNNKKVTKKAPARKVPAKKVKAEKKKIEGSEKRNFILLSWDANEIGKYTGRAPRQAALKAANRGVQDIILREAGKRKVVVHKNEKVTCMKVHRFDGSIKTRPKTKSDPEWMNDPVSIPVAKKVCSCWIPMRETELADYLGD